MALAEIKDFNVASNSASSLLTGLIAAGTWAIGGPPDYSNGTDKISWLINSGRGSNINTVVEFTTTGALVQQSIWPGASYNLSTGIGSSGSSHRHSSSTAVSMTPGAASTITMVKHSDLIGWLFTENGFSTYKAFLGYTKNSLLSLNNEWLDDSVWTKVLAIKNMDTFYYCGNNIRSIASPSSSSNFKVISSPTLDWTGKLINTGLSKVCTNVPVVDPQGNGLLFALPAEFGFITPPAYPKFGLDTYRDGASVWLPIGFIGSSICMVKYSGVKL